MIVLVDGLYLSCIVCGKIGDSENALGSAYGLIMPVGTVTNGTSQHLIKSSDSIETLYIRIGLLAVARSYCGELRRQAKLV